MSSLLVARKDFMDSVRSSILTALLGVFILALLVIALGYLIVVPRRSMASMLVYVTTLVKWLVPITALLAGYSAIVGERDGNTITFLLGLPITRGDVLAGKVLGRSAAVLLPITVAFLGIALITIVAYPTFLPLALLTLFGASALLAVVFVSVSVAISALTDSPVRAASATVAVFIACMFLWDLLPSAAYFLVNGTALGSQDAPAWFWFLMRLNPLEAFLALLASVMPTMATRVPADGPIYLSVWATLGIFLAWISIPLGAGYLRFDTDDLT